MAFSLWNSLIVPKHIQEMRYSPQETAEAHMGWTKGAQHDRTQVDRPTKVNAELGESNLNRFRVQLWIEKATISSILIHW
jgi:hypothetical protein